MFAPPFLYYRARSLGEACELLTRHPGAKLLAGGHSLIPLLKLRLAAPPALVDIGRLAELKGIDLVDDTLRIGALTTHAELAASPLLRARCPVLAEAAALIGDPQVRNRGTIGGNVAHADPAADLPPVLVCLEAQLTSVGPGGERRLAASEFFQGLMATALTDREVLTTITVPVIAAGTGTAYVKFPHPASRYAVVSAAARLTMRGNVCTQARLVLGGIGPRPLRAPSVEAALEGRPLDPARIAEAATGVAHDLGGEVTGDLFASAAYRRAMAAVYARRALTTALERAAGQDAAARDPHQA
jgi:carbon-monoxide dehydrogenase medium subunit